MLCALNSLGLLLMRLAASALMVLGHGWAKYEGFDNYAKFFPPMFGMTGKQALSMAIVGEVVCPALVALGFLTRAAALGAAITMGVAAFVAHEKDPYFAGANAVVETTEKKTHVGVITKQDEKEIVMMTGGAEVTIPRGSIVSQNPQRSKEMALLFLIPFATLVFTGPGKASVDGLLFRRKKAISTPPVKA